MEIESVKGKSSTDKRKRRQARGSNAGRSQRVA